MFTPKRMPYLDSITLGTNQRQKFKNNMSTITVTNNANEGNGSLRAAIKKAQSGDTIKFDDSLANQTITLNNFIGIRKSLTIDGSDAPDLTISGGEKTNILRLARENKSLTVRNLSLADSYYEAQRREERFGLQITALLSSKIPILPIMSLMEQLYTVKQVATLQSLIVPLTIMTEPRLAIKDIPQGQLVYLPMAV